MVKVKSRSKIRKRAGAGGRQDIFAAANAPFAKSRASYFRFARLIRPHSVLSESLAQARILYLRWLKLRNRLRPLTNSSMNLVENPELYFIFSDVFAFSPFLINNDEY